jgi:hypothetical protein
MAYSLSELEAHRRTFREGARAAFLRDGPMIDLDLANELRRPNTDQRCGINFVCRPTTEIRKAITGIQKHLNNLEPEQYYYPELDIHLTLLEMCHSRMPQEVIEIANDLTSKLLSLFQDVASFTLYSPALSLDRRGCALTFLPSNDTLQLSRDLLAIRLRDSGIPLAPRYKATSAHVSIMRYVLQPKCDRHSWVQTVSDILLDATVQWQVSEVWMTWGPNWYGMRNRIQQAGPFQLRSNDNKSLLSG